MYIYIYPFPNKTCQQLTAKQGKDAVIRNSTMPGTADKSSVECAKVQGFLSHNGSIVKLSVKTP